MNKTVMTSLMAAALALPALVLPAAAQAGEVYNREQHQENRIYQGVANDSLTRGEYDNLQTREASLNAQRSRDLARHDGHLTPQEYRNLNRRENNLSRAIYRDKHNRFNAP
jgi:hypothetical protein